MDEFPAAQGRLQEAFRDLSRRPEADVPGAITHAFAALEGVYRKIIGSSGKTFGDIPRSNLVYSPDLWTKAWTKCGAGNS